MFLSSTGWFEVDIIIRFTHYPFLDERQVTDAAAHIRRERYISDLIKRLSHPICFTRQVNTNEIDTFQAASTVSPHGEIVQSSSIRRVPFVRQTQSRCRQHDPCAEKTRPGKLHLKTTAWSLLHSTPTSRSNGQIVTTSEA